MATVNLGSIKFKWEGTYSGATAYTVDDVVEYNGSSYICILASTGNLPTNATYFEQMSQAGTNGTDLTTTLTTQGDILYRDGSGLQRLGIGTAGQALKVNSGATGYEFGTAGGFNTPAFYVSASAPTIMSSAYTYYPMTFNTEVVDSDNCFDTTTYRFTPNVAGYYLLNVRIGAYWGYGRSFATSPHNLNVSIYKNGSGFRSQAWANSFAQNCNCHSGGMTISTIAYANGSTDYFTIYSWADVAGYSMYGEEFSGFKLIGV